MATKGKQPDWALIRRGWEETTESLAAISHRCGAPASTIRARARREGWRARPAHDRRGACEAALILYDDLNRSLSDALVTLRDPAGDDPREARGRAELIRAHRKALAALLEAQSTLKEADAKPAAFTFDRDAARREFRARLDRFMAHSEAGEIS